MRECSILHSPATARCCRMCTLESWLGPLLHAHTFPFRDCECEPLSGESSAGRIELESDCVRVVCACFFSCFFLLTQFFSRRVLFCVHSFVRRFPPHATAVQHKLVGRLPSLLSNCPVCWTVPDTRPICGWRLGGSVLKDFYSFVWGTARRLQRDTAPNINRGMQARTTKPAKRTNKEGRHKRENNRSLVFFLFCLNDYMQTCSHVRGEMRTGKGGAVSPCAP